MTNEPTPTVKAYGKTTEELDKQGQEALDAVRDTLSKIHEDHPASVPLPPMHFSDKFAENLVGTYQHFISEAKRRLEAAEEHGKFSDLLVTFWAYKSFYKDLEDLRKQLNALIMTYDRAVIPATFERLDQDKVQVPSIGRSFYPSTKYSASMTDKEKGFEWLIERGDGDIITKTVNAGTLASYLRAYEEDEGKSAPEDIFKLSTYQGVGSSKYTPKK